MSANFVFSAPQLDSQKLNRKILDNPGERIGSLHRFRDGYGFGATVPTSRNAPTLPPSVPAYRYPPEFDSIPDKQKPMKLARKDVKSIRRQADALEKLTSGAYGSFLSPQFQASREAYTLNSQPPRPSVHSTAGITLYNLRPQTTSFGMRPDHSGGGTNSNQDVTYQQMNRTHNQHVKMPDAPTPRYQVAVVSPSTRLISTSQGSRQDLFRSTLENLDAAFSRKAKYDLIATGEINQNSDSSVARRCVLESETSHLRNYPWTNKLRK